MLDGAIGEAGGSATLVPSMSRISKVSPGSAAPSRALRLADVLQSMPYIWYMPHI
jgi:hypothetical protein